MQNSTPPIMTAGKFSTAVKEWAGASRTQMVANAKNRGKGKGVLAKNITKRVNASYGIPNRVRFGIPRYGVYLHYGVGRSHVRNGSSVVRDETIPKTYRYKGKEHPYTEEKIKARKFRQKYYKRRTRSPIDWFDVVIRTGIKKLADYSIYLTTFLPKSFTLGNPASRFYFFQLVDYVRFNNQVGIAFSWAALFVKSEFQCISLSSGWWYMQRHHDLC